jgi:hypothetical protein
MAPPVARATVSRARKIVLGGTGAYVDLHGQGQGWTDYSPFQVNGTVINHYTGFLLA